jgi:hypothetical protein
MWMQFPSIKLRNLRTSTFTTQNNTTTTFYKKKKKTFATRTTTSFNLEDITHVSLEKKKTTNNQADLHKK